MKKVMCVVVILGMAALANAALLSENVVGTGSLFPSETKITTGATYQWLAGTDSSIAGSDLQGTKMIDGVGAAGGATFALWSNWDGGDATLVFDLKAQYQITSTGVYTNLDWPNTGLPYLSVYTSTDGSSYTPFGSWLDNPANGTDVLATVNGQAIDAQYVKFVFMRSVDYPGQGGRQNWSHNYILGEAMVYGNAIPEPATLTLLSLGGIFTAIRRKRK
jgi:hypothetical protein